MKKDKRTDKSDDWGYFEGLTPEMKEKLSKMTPEERELDLEEERKSCEAMKDW